jgi:hypothetical protein
VKRLKKFVYCLLVSPFLRAPFSAPVRSMAYTSRDRGASSEGFWGEAVPMDGPRRATPSDSRAISTSGMRLCGSRYGARRRARADDVILPSTGKRFRLEEPTASRHPLRRGPPVPFEGAEGMERRPAHDAPAVRHPADLELPTRTSSSSPRIPPQGLVGHCRRSEATGGSELRPGANSSRFQALENGAKFCIAALRSSHHDLMKIERRGASPIR